MAKYNVQVVSPLREEAQPVKQEKHQGLTDFVSVGVTITVGGGRKSTFHRVELRLTHCNYMFWIRAIFGLRDAAMEAVLWH